MATMTGSVLNNRKLLGIAAAFAVVMLLMFMLEDDVVMHGDMMRNVMDWSSHVFAVKSTTDTGLQSPSRNPALQTEDMNLRSQYELNEIHKERNMRLEQTCARSTHGYIGNSKDEKVEKFIALDQRHNYIYCRVHKAGSTFLSRLFRTLNTEHSKTGMNSSGMIKLGKYKEQNGFTKAHRAVTSFFKIMFTRDPYSRLFSGYVDKLFTVNTLYWGMTGKYIKQAILNRSSTKCGHGITFPQFIKYIIHSETTGKHKDRHFTPIYEHCRPCQMLYDFIGKMETFMDDSLFLVKTWNKLYDLNITFNDFEADTSLKRAITHTGRLYGMRSGLEKCMTFYEGMNRVWKDLQIRGLLSKNVSLPFSEKEAEYVNKTQFVDALTQAIQGQDVDRKYLRKQKRESLIQAYSEVPMDDLVRLREVVRPDCELFGYDDSPDYIFSRNDPAYKIDPFKYFDVGAVEFV